MIETTSFGSMKVVMLVYSLFITDPTTPVLQNADIVSFTHCKNMQEMVLDVQSALKNPFKFDEFKIVLCNRFS